MNYKRTLSEWKSAALTSLLLLFSIIYTDMCSICLYIYEEEHSQLRKERGAKNGDTHILLQWPASSVLEINVLLLFFSFIF